MSSLGSRRSSGGVGSASALAMLTSPKPVRSSQPEGGTSVAEKRSTSATWPIDRSGRAVDSQAAAPETIGAAKLVPSATVTPSAAPSVVSNATGSAAGTCSPGAARSIASSTSENELGASVVPTDPTDSTCGNPAGYTTGSPSAASLPAAATARDPSP